MPTVLELIEEHRLTNQIKQCPYDLAETVKTTNDHLGFMKKLGLFQTTKPTTSHQEMVFVYQMNAHVYAIREYFKDTMLRRRRGKPASLRMKHNRFNNTLSFVTPDSNGEELIFTLGNRLTEAMFSGWTTPVVKRCLRVLDQAGEVDLTYYKDLEAMFKVILTFLAVKVAVDYYHRSEVAVDFESTLQRIDKQELLDTYEETPLYKLANVLKHYASHGATEIDFNNDLPRATGQQLTRKHVEFIVGYINYRNYRAERFDLSDVLNELVMHKDVKLFMSECTISDVYCLQLTAELMVSNIKFALNNSNHAYGSSVYMNKLEQRIHAKIVTSINSELLQLASYMAVNKTVL